VDQPHPVVPAADEELTARFIGTIQIADMIADDARGVIYSMGRFQYETTKVPNLKVGMGMNQSTLNQLDRLTGMGTFRGDLDAFGSWQTRALASVRLGVLQRMEQLRVAMLCDGIGFAYDRFGIKLTNPSWGMFADLKVTVGTGWDTAATATPVNDILTVVDIAAQRYGITYDRVTMSKTAFRYMIATTEFQTKAKPFLPANLTFGNMQLLNDIQQKGLAQNVLGLQIELYDARYWSQDTTGAVTSARFLPTTNVILTDSTNDGRAEVWDMANGVVTESIVARVARTSVIGNLESSYGPVAYVTPSDPNLNPPGIVHWGVGRSFPRKHVLQSSAVLSVGSFSDIVSTAVPFPQ
jgi:hypothetical protein